MSNLFKLLGQIFDFHIIVVQDGRNLNWRHLYCDIARDSDNLFLSEVHFGIGREVLKEPGPGSLFHRENVSGIDQIIELGLSFGRQALEVYLVLLKSINEDGLQPIFWLRFPVVHRVQLISHFYPQHLGLI